MRTPLYLSRRQLLAVVYFLTLIASPSARAQTVTITGSGADNSVKYDFGSLSASLGTVNSQSNGVGDVKGTSQPTAQSSCMYSRSQH